jgi:hypothetical protein
MRQHTAVEKIRHKRAQQRVADIAEYTGQWPQTGTERRHAARTQVRGERREHQPRDSAGIGKRHCAPAVRIDDEHLGPYTGDRCVEVVTSSIARRQSTSIDTFSTPNALHASTLSNMMRCEPSIIPMSSR